MSRYGKFDKKAHNVQQPPAPMSATARPQAHAPAAGPYTAEKPRSMEQERTAFALGKIQDLTTYPDQAQYEVRRHVNGLPALIRMNGLGQALAFYRMQGEDSTHALIYRIVGEWLCGEKSKGRVFVGGDGDALVAITRSDISTYMAAQNESLALLEWLKKFALALLKKEEKN